MIKFVKEHHADNKEKYTYFAIAENAKWEGSYYEELLFCELIPSKDCVSVSWEDDWKNHVKFVTLDEAMQYVNENYSRHEPHKQGSPWIE